MERPIFNSRGEYGPCLTDAAFWRPYVAEICGRQGLSCGAIRAGMAGTFPAMIVDERYVVKLYSDLFAGAACWALETECYRLISAAVPDFPIATLLARGTLFAAGEPWSWPYMVTALVPGVSIGEVWASLAFDERAAVTTALGPLLRALHALPLPSKGPLAGTWDAFRAAMARRRAACVEDHRAWGDLSAALLAGLEGYLLPIDELLDQRAPPALVHADLNGDHLLGRLEEGVWQTSGIIDFSDACAGDPLYELVALHLRLFHADKRLLRLFLAAYGPVGRQEEAQFVQKAMCYSLLFEFGMGALIDEFPPARHAASLEELAHLLWDVRSPGLPGSERA